MSVSRPIHVAIACGGTGGHLFPGLAVGRALVRQGARATLLISPKEVDQQAVKDVSDVRIATLPAVGLQGRNHAGFAWSFLKSIRASRSLFRQSPPEVVLAMGGFTSAPPILAGRLAGAVTALHESNTIPGRANRWLSRVVTAAFVGFDETVARLPQASVEVTGTPVRGTFVRRDPASCRVALGLAPDQPVVAVLGGSQGASGLNDAVREALPAVARHWPALQFIHLAGPRDVATMEAAYAGAGLRALVMSFTDRVDDVLGAATLAVARSGASTLAEFAAMGVPSVLVPFPAAVDDHQRHNAEAFVRAGAARCLAQRDAQPRVFCDLIGDLLEGGPAWAQMSEAAFRLHRPQAADRIAERLLSMLGGPFSAVADQRAPSRNRREPAPKAMAPGKVGCPVSST
jgi:UDP-N-acetylglucosamine--N-acetylmuramyl-(pentapeptide) pyrophosphoryl-undecaprenol N-acetylglucosamine transferase